MYAHCPGHRPEARFVWELFRELGYGGVGMGDGDREGKGEPYGALRYRSVVSIEPRLSFSECGSAVVATRGLLKGDASFLSN